MTKYFSNEPAHLEDLRKTMTFAQSDAADESVADESNEDGTIKNDPAATTVKMAAASGTVKNNAASSTLKKTDASGPKASGTVKVVDKSKAPLPNPKTNPASKAATPAKPLAKTSAAPRVKTGNAGNRSGPNFRREPTFTAEPVPKPEDIKAAEEEFLRSMQATRASGGFKASYETSDQLDKPGSGTLRKPEPRRQQQTSPDVPPPAYSEQEEEEYQQAVEAVEHYGMESLSPKQQMLLRKRSQADQKANALKTVTQQTYLSQKALKEGIRDLNTGNTRKSISYTPPEDNNQEQRPAQGSGRGSRFMGDTDLLTKSMGGPQRRRDDRPITPMKKDIYKEASKDLDFQNGVPVDPQIADVYYSYYDEFEDEQPQASQTMFEPGHHHHHHHPHQGHTPYMQQQRVRFVSQEGRYNGPVSPEDDRTELANYMATVLTRPSMPSRSVTVVDDMPDMFGPNAKQSKIKAMRQECEGRLGPVKFRQAYDYLKSARSGVVDENKINNDLRRLLGNVNDAFMVDQLLFLENA